jgi:hypothetical protein
MSGDIFRCTIKGGIKRSTFLRSLMSTLSRHALRPSRFPFQFHPHQEPLPRISAIMAGNSLQMPEFSIR